MKCDFGTNTKGGMAFCSKENECNTWFCNKWPMSWNHLLARSVKGSYSVAKTHLEALDSIAAFLIYQTLAIAKACRLISNVCIKARALLTKKGQIVF
uniref:Uncharacterized protein n=1 Tax=Rhipicephalus appendiculatus TaxID=34631 RepID=A0A131YHP0_RHIAP